MADWRDEKLRNLLPSKDDPYAFDSLSEVELKALDAAFGDGFGAAVKGSEAFAAPAADQERIATASLLLPKPLGRRG
jgi:hypothetical protein